MCCALVSYVLSNVYMLQSEVNWFMYCTAYTGLFLYHVFNTVMLHSLTVTLSGKCFQKWCHSGLEMRQMKRSF